MPTALGARQVERQLRRRRRCRRGCAPPPPPTCRRSGVADAEERRPLGARVRRRHRDERQAGRRRRRLGRVDRAAAADARGSPSTPPAARRSGRDGISRPARRGRQIASASQRALATSSGRSMPTLGEHAGQLLEPPADDHVRARSRANATNACAARGSARPAARAIQISRVEVEPLDARLGERAGRELGLDRAARDERDAVAGLRRRCAPTPGARARAARRGRAACAPLLRSSSSTICRTPAPSCIRISGPSRELVERRPSGRRTGARAGRRGSPRRGRTARRRPTRCRRAAPTIPSSSSPRRRRARRPTACRARRARRAARGSRAGTRRGGAASDDRRRARSRRRSRACPRAPRPGSASSVEQLLLEREQPLRAAVEPQPGLGRLDAAARSGRAAASRAAARARAPAG